MGLDLMTQNSAIARQVIEIIAEQAVLEPDEVQQHETLEALGIDSLGLVECIFAIEQTFDITVPFNANNPDEGSFDISSVGAVIREVERLVESQG